MINALINGREHGKNRDLQAQVQETTLVKLGRGNDAVLCKNEKIIL